MLREFVCWFVRMCCTMHGGSWSRGGSDYSRIRLGVGGCVQRDTGAGAHVLHAEQKHHLCVCMCVCVCARVSFFLVPRGQNKTSKASRLSFINANQCVWNEVKYMNAATEIVVGWDSLVSLANWAPSFHWWTRGDSSGGNQDKVPSWVPFQWTNVLERPLFTLNIDFLHTGSYSWCPFHIFCPCPSNIMSPPVSLTLLTLSRSLTPVAS